MRLLKQSFSWQRAEEKVKEVEEKEAGETQNTSRIQDTVISLRWGGPGAKEMETL